MLYITEHVAQRIQYNSRVSQCTNYSYICKGSLMYRHQENPFFILKMYWTTWDNLRLLKSAWDYLKLLKSFKQIGLAWWATQKKISQVTWKLSSTPNTSKQHEQLSIGINQLSIGSQATQVSIFKQWKILLESDLKFLKCNQVFQSEYEFSWLAVGSCPY